MNEQIQVRSIEVGRVGRIPVKNLWLLMLYASDLFRTAGSRNVGLEESPDELPDLIAEILAHAVEQRRRRQLSASFQARQGVINRVRGRINVLATERRQLLARGLVSCRFDELTVDTPRNRFVRAALESIARIVRRREVAHRCRSLAAMLKEQGVKGYAPSRHEMNIVQFSRNDSDDRYMVAAAKLAFDLCLPTEEIGSAYLSIPDREAAWVRRLFERAVGGFYAVVLEPKGWRVRCGKILDWQVEGKTSGIDRILPCMRTDIILEDGKSGRRIVVDTKFTSIVTSGWHREETLRSGYVYQIYSYLRSQVGVGDEVADSASGMLLHPAVGAAIDETVVIQGHSVRFATVDLTGSPSEIRAQLLRLTLPVSQAGHGLLGAVSQFA